MAMISTSRVAASEDGRWLSDHVMNLLVDYYPEVHCRPYGSTATRKNVLPALQSLDLGYLCIYAKGHSGYTTWKSSLNTQHERLAQDMPRFFRKVTRAANTRLVLYYSGMVDGLAGIRHPDWRMRNADGTPKQLFADFKLLVGHALCPLSPYFDRWVSVHLRELITNYDPDGIWVDGDWPGPCYCPRCQARFRAATGWTGAWDKIRRRPDFEAAYRPVWNQTEHEWRTRFKSLIKSLKPTCIYSAGNVSPRREFLAPFDWRSGDFFSPGHFEMHDVSRMMRWYDTLGVPYDAYVCDTSFTHVRKQVRSRTKTLDRMQQEAATVAANGGAVGYWTYPTGPGALVPSRMRKAAAVREFLREREDVFLHTTSASRTAIVVSDPASPAFGSHGVIGAHKALAALHHSPAVMDETGVAEDMPYDLVVLPEQPSIPPAVVRRLEAFVRQGGTLLTNGASLKSPALRRLLGIKRVKFGAVSDGHVFPHNSDEPTGIDRPWDRVALAGSRELYPLYRSWDADNPGLKDMPNNWPMHGHVDEEHPERAGCPAAILRRVGRGRAIHICTDIFSHYAQLGDPQMLRWLREVIDRLQPDPFFRTDAPSWVDVSLRRKNGRWLIHFVNLNPGRDLCKLNTDDTWVDEIPEIGPFTAKWRLSRRPGAARWVPGNSKLRTTWSRGVLSLEVPRFRIHGCAVIDPR